MNIADMSCNRKVAYICNPELLTTMNMLPKFETRATMVNELLASYGLMKNVNVVEPKAATEEQLKAFHTDEYINFLRKSNSLEDDTDDEDFENGEEYGLGYDCPFIPHIYDVMLMLAGATITAAQLLANETCTVAINWCGGWHHAKKDEAAGFCYVNDIVLGILELKRKFSRILYVDLDLHHGDGVEDAFAYSPSVLCFSVHKYENGFFPGTGSIGQVGFGKGQYYTLNIPLKDGISDEHYSNIVCSLLKRTEKKYKPDAIVCQCGADTLHGDPMCAFNLTLKGAGICIEEILSWNKPTLLLGGGGYNFVNTARLWTYLTSLACGIDLSNEIPDHDFLLSYGPDYELHILKGNRSDCNDEQYIKEILTTAFENLEFLH